MTKLPSRYKNNAYGTKKLCKAKVRYIKIKHKNAYIFSHKFYVRNAVFVKSKHLTAVKINGKTTATVFNKVKIQNKIAVKVQK